MTSPNVLVVEDNPVNQRVTLTILRQIGIGADLAEDGLQAITMFKSKQYALVLMDCQLPRLDGWGATRAIRRLEEGTLNHVTIIALTAQALAGDREKCLQSGMDDYLTKPVNAQLLQQTVRAVLKNAASRQLASSATPPTAMGAMPDSLIGNDLAVSHMILDAEIVATIRGFGTEGMRDVYGIMLNDLPQRRRQLALALQQLDAKTLAAVAHGVKGACGTVGARALGQAAAQLERLGRAQDLEAATQMWGLVDELFAKTLTEMKGLVTE